MRTFPLLICLILSTVQAAAQPPLELEKKIPLGNVSGRIDHFAIDRGGQRLFLAELGNDTVSVIDLASGTVAHRIAGLKEPQGVGYLPETKSLIVANGDDGAVRAFDGNFASAATLNLGGDADNVRVDPGTGSVIVGFGSGALAILDGRKFQKKAEIKLKAHPESFQIDWAAKRAYVNVPDAREIAVVDLDRGKQVAAWTKLPAGANFPMVLLNGGKLAVGFRSPARLAILDTRDGAAGTVLPLCGDTDDLFFDARRDRLYASCGGGEIDVFENMSTVPKLLAEVATVSGARTAFFYAEADRYYLAVRAGLNRPAEIWVYRPF